ncbi:MAG: GDP-mannose 4,6-dehydratase [Candidatus Woesearchaeota archaeon]|jgi:UDP-glucose 4-epimerase|nr:GDP-mannose 4,6-dehydratase [Candidatus Woesearchaeota archaeon]MDP7324494.1 GDP-mannose 4,6-dehydratase [Candidatus Woesearchaeota archaeon]MDP7458270.1 GDP-mannose 4,6-dehydratase [Candidatus Woesearchaeota archaeon]
MKVLITGGAGFIGSYVSEKELALGNEVIAFDVSGDEKIQHLLDNPKFEYVKGSILDRELLETHIQKVDLIYHLAAIANVQHYILDPLRVLDIGVKGTIAVLELAHKHKKKVLFSSTSEVYGKNPKIPWKENDDRVLGPTTIDRWCYSSSKAVGEHYCYAYKKKGLKVVVVRYFNVIGPRLDALDTGRVITIFLGQLLKGKPITVIGDGKQTRCFTDVEDAAEATVQAMHSPKTEGDVLNIGNDTETTIKDLAELMIKLGNFTSKIEHVSKDDVYGKEYEDVPRRQPNVDKVKKLLGWKASIPLEETLKKTIAYFTDQVKSEKSQK